MVRDLGGDLVRVFTGYENPAAEYGRQWKLVVETLRECARRAAEYGVTIGVQNHHDLGTAWQSQYDLIHEVGEANCKAVFDAWAPALHGADLREAARRMAPITVQTIVANYQLRPRFRYDAAIVNFIEEKPALSAVPVDEGFIDYAAFLQALYEGGFRGNVVYEMCSPLQGWERRADAGPLRAAVCGVSAGAEAAPRMQLAGRRGIIGRAVMSRFSWWAMAAAAAAMLCLAACGTQRAGAPAQPRTVKVAQMGPADVVGNDDKALQAAMKLLKPGDTLAIGPGTYEMNNSVFVPSGVTVRGTAGTDNSAQERGRREQAGRGRATTATRCSSWPSRRNSNRAWAWLSPTIKPGRGGTSACRQ